ncbi:MAG: DUF6468 domain-containing protein [Parvularculaceae bacterium]
MSLEIIVEAVVAALLVATCVYCLVLSRRLKRLRDTQRELLTVIDRFDNASRRAGENLENIRTARAAMERDLDGLMGRAGGLIDELQVMVHAGDRIAGRIEGAVGEVRALGARGRGESNEDAA